MSRLPRPAAGSESQGSGGPPLLVHAGGLPTASWYLRRLLDSNEAQLRSLGVRPVRVRPKVALTEIEAEVAGARTERGVRCVILAGDFLGPVLGPGGLFPEAASRMSRWTEVFRAHEPLVAVSVCALDELLEAALRQQVSGGNWVDPDEWLAGVDLEEASWLPLFADLLSLLGPEHVIGVQDDPMLEPRERLARLMTAAGLPTVALPPNPRWRSPALSRKGLELALVAAPHAHNAAERGDISRWLVRHFSDSHAPALRIFDDPTRAKLRDRSDAELPALTSNATAFEGYHVEF